jgi:hypothetical protein
VIASWRPVLMSQTLTVELPDELARRARSLAAAGNRRLEEAVIDWISRAVAEPEIEALPDDELLTRCDSALAAAVQDELSGLLADAREDKLGATERARLDQLMGLYRRGMIEKARAWKEAVARGLRPSLAGADANADHAS